MSRLGCFLQLSAAVVLCLAASSNGFQPGSLSTEYMSSRRLRLTFNYTATSKPDVMVSAFYKGAIRRKSLRRSRFRDNTGEVGYDIPSTLQLSQNVTFRFPESTFTLLLRPFPLPPAKGAPSIDRTEPIPHVRFQLEGDIVYAESGDVSYNLAVPADAGRNDVIEEKLSYTAYVKDGSVFKVSKKDWPVTVVEAAALDSGAEYRLEFNTSLQQRPEGVLLLKALKVYSEGGSHQLIHAVEVEKRVDFYQQGHREPVPDDDSTLALVRQWTDTNGRSTQLCDMSETPECRVSCAAVSGGSPRVEIRKTTWDFSKLPNATTSSRMGFLTVTSAPVPDVGYSGEVMFECRAVFGKDYARVQKQVVVLTARDRPQILRELSSAVLHPNQTLEVRCAAKGLPVPTVTITEPGDPGSSGTPLAERFPNQSFTRTVELNRQVRVQYWLAQPSFTSALSHVRCSADNGFRDPDVVLLEVVPA